MTITLYQISLSPNSIKVRAALKYKQIEFKCIEVDPQDREALIERTGQSLTPAIIHGDVILFDSQAILRYLDANFRDTPRIFPVLTESHQSVEKWEGWAKTNIYDGLVTCAKQFFQGKNDSDQLKYSLLKLSECAGRIEGALIDSEFLVGNELTAADFTAAAGLSYSVLTEEQAKASPLHQFCFDNISLCEGFPKTRVWLSKVLSYSA